MVGLRSIDLPAGSAVFIGQKSREYRIGVVGPVAVITNIPDSLTKNRNSTTISRRPGTLKRAPVTPVTIFPCRIAAGVTQGALDVGTTRSRVISKLNTLLDPCGGGTTIINLFQKSPLRTIAMNTNARVSGRDLPRIFFRRSACVSRDSCKGGKGKKEE